VIIYTVGGVTGFALSSFAGAFLPAIPFLHGAGFTVGASAPVFGLIGALYHYGRTSSSLAKQMAQSIIIQAVLFGVVMGNAGIDNFAHLGGLASGFGLGKIMMDRPPVSPEEQKRAQILGWSAALAVLVSFTMMVLGILRTR
jgi:rhomboid protease GluP